MTEPQQSSSWTDGLQMEAYTPPEEDEGDNEQFSSLQIPAGIVWKDKSDETSSLNLSTCLDPKNAETVLQWKAVQKSDYLLKQLVKDSTSSKGTLPVGSCQIHLGGTALQLDLVTPIQVVDDDADDGTFDLKLGTKFVKHYNMEADLEHHQVKVPQGETCVTIPMIQPRGNVETSNE
jgi:hypothetical protein